MNSLKSFMTKVGERVREVTPQSPGRSSLGDVEDGIAGGETMEGFVCPSCFMSLPDPEQLQQHYEAEHMEPGANYLCPVCKARLNSQAELEIHYGDNHATKDMNNQSVEALREELTELSTNLREERWHSEELRREVERLQEAFKKKTDEGEEEFVYKSQLDAVEQSKSLLSSEVLLLRNQLSQSIEQSTLLRSEKDSLESRASEFAVERAELRATLDTLQAEKVSLESQLHEIKANRASQDSLDHAEVTRLTLEITKLNEQLMSHEKEVQALKDRENILQNDLKEKSELASAAREEMRNLKQEVDIMKKKLQGRDDVITGLKVEVQKHELHSRASEGIREKLEASCCELAGKISALEAEKAALDSKCRSYERELETSSNESAVLKDKLIALDSEKSDLLRQFKEKL